MYCVILDIFTITIGGIGGSFVYFYGYLTKDVTHVEFNTRIQTDIY